MSWARGLFRLWVVATVLWIAGAVALNWTEISCKLGSSADAKPWERYRCGPFDDLIPFNWQNSALVLGGPPLLLLLLGSLFYWAIRGFRLGKGTTSTANRDGGEHYGA